MIILGNHSSVNDYLRFCGGKAKGLYLLSEAGVDIPETLVIPANLELSKYEENINDFSKSLQAKYPNVRFAVRSSALTEDGADCSWAGMYDTMLNITSDELYKTISQMYTYSATTRQKIYREFSNSDELSTKMGLVVQWMIKPDVAGVCFTINPISGDENEIMIEAVNGLGEKLVGGEITPQLFILDKTGNCQYFDCGDCSTVQIITESVLRELFELINYLKYNVIKDADIEFAIQNNRVYFLQIRHITRKYHVSI